VAEDPTVARFLPLFEPGVALARRRSPGAAGPGSSADQAQRLRVAVQKSNDRLAK